jgi:hypothetical protein
MESRWYPLNQDHFPPPDLPESGLGTGNGVICLGHIIPRHSCLDKVFNRSEEGIQFTPSVPVIHEYPWKLDWIKDKGPDTGLATGVEAPMKAAALVSTEPHVQLRFEHTVTNHQKFDILDRYIINVDRAFIGNILEDEAVATRIEQALGVRLSGLGDDWCIYMITGIMVARGATEKSEESGILQAMSSTTT